MKEKFRKTIMKVWVVPIPVLVMIMTLLNYGLGSMMSSINQLYSNIQQVTRAEFVVKNLS